MSARAEKEKPHMARFAIAAFAVTALATGGCTYEKGLTPHHNPSITSVNEPVVQRTDYVLDLAAGGGMAPSELDRLHGWFQTIGIGYGDTISVDDGGVADPAVRDEIARAAGAYGLLLSDAVPVTTGPVQPGSVRVILSRTTASVPGCPMWDASEIGARITTSPNYGCAVNSNIALMVANPSDLVVGQSGGATVDAAAASRAIQTYRTRALTGAGGSVVQSGTSSSATGSTGGSGQ